MAGGKRPTSALRRGIVDTIPKPERTVAGGKRVTWALGPDKVDLIPKPEGWKSHLSYTTDDHFRAREERDLERKAASEVRATRKYGGPRRPVPEQRSSGCCAILGTGLAVCGGILTLFGGIAAYFAFGNSIEDKFAGGDSGGESPDDGEAFAASSRYFGDAEKTLGNADPGDGWVGSAATQYGDQNTLLMDLARQMAETDQGVKAAMKTEADQVNEGSDTIGGVMDWIDLAIPVAEALHAAGPHGAALSFSFQVAVASAGVGVSGDKLNEMSSNSRQNAARLAELTERYEAVSRTLAARGMTS